MRSIKLFNLEIIHETISICWWALLQKKSLKLKWLVLSGFFGHAENFIGGSFIQYFRIKKNFSFDLQQKCQRISSTLFNLQEISIALCSWKTLQELARLINLICSRKVCWIFFNLFKIIWWNIYLFSGCFEILIVQISRCIRNEKILFENQFVDASFFSKLGKTLNLPTLTRHTI